MLTFDYIVVGAGSAGAPLAARLSEKPSLSVLLLEAGPDFRSSQTPAEMRSPNFLEVVIRGGHHWPDLSAQLLAAQNPKLYLRGFGVGGTSAINALGAARGAPADYDAWASGGCAGWSWKLVLPTFVRLENDVDFGDRPYHGDSGPLPVERTPRSSWGAVDEAFAAATLDLGYPWNDDANAPDATGVSPGPKNSRNGYRISTNDAYLEDARGRPNLTIKAGCLVDTVRLDGTRAVGVHVIEQDDRRVYEAGEVILCGGAIHSPTILMRSGIGNADELTQLGIDCVVDLPGVGENLHDHPLIQLPLVLREHARMASLRLPPHNCGLRTASALGIDNDIAMYSANGGVSLDEGAIGVAVMQPLSRGRVHLRSSDTRTNPSIQFHMLDRQQDIDRLREAVERGLQILRHRAFGDVAEALPPITDLQRTEPSTDQWLRAKCEEFFHAAGSCRMGPPDDSRSVVDPDCRVLGMEGLRVADASIMPTLPRAAPHLTTVMIAEHLAPSLIGG